MSKSVVYIEPLENLKGAKVVNCNMHYVAGSKSGLTYRCTVSTDYFKYYNYGFALEVVTTDRFNNIIDIADPKTDDLKNFGIRMDPAVGYNAAEHSIESRSGFIYKLKDTIMCRKLGTKCINLIEEDISRAVNFSIVMYLVRGALMSVAVVKNVKDDTFLSKYVIGSGCGVLNKQILKTLIPYSKEDYGSGEKLSQSDIDKLLEQIREEQRDVW